jgi:NADH-quinone oxidoreductase subunit H
LAPFLTLFLSLSGWVIIPSSFDSYIVDINLSLIYVLVISSLGIYGVLLAGWSSNSKYALLGSLRSVSQMISYEIVISLTIVPVILLSGSLNLLIIVYIQSQSVWFICPLLPLGVIFFISILAETNRTPFDLPEAESELVAGYNIEYTSVLFAMFFLGEYANILLMSSIYVILFFGGWDFFNCTFMSEFIFSLKVVIVVLIFVLTRANIPRYRFDQLMVLGWKFLIPLTLSGILFTSGFLLSFNALLLAQVPKSPHLYCL